MKLLKNSKVFVVDDEPSILLIISEILEAENFIVYSYNNPIEALANVEKEKPDLIITDLKMPEMDGLTLLSKIKELKCDTYVLFLSGYMSKDNLIEGVLRGSSGFIEKPIKELHFKLTVKNAL